MSNPPTFPPPPEGQQPPPPDGQQWAPADQQWANPWGQAAPAGYWAGYGTGQTQANNPPGSHQHPPGLSPPGLTHQDTWQHHYASSYGAGETEPRPGAIPLRPLTVSELLDGAITAVRSHPKATFGLSAMLSLVVMVGIGLPLTSLTRWAMSHIPLQKMPKELAESGVTEAEWNEITAGVFDAIPTLISSGFLAIGGAIAIGILSYLVGQAVLGRTVTASQCWKATRGRVGALLGFLALLTLSAAVLIVVVILVWVIGLIILALLGPLGLIALVVVLPLGGLLTLFLGVVFMFYSSVCPSVIVLERLGPFGSLRRVTGLLRNQLWRSLGIATLAYVLIIIISSVIVIPVSIVNSIFSFLAEDSSQFQWLFQLLADLVTALAGVVTSVVTWPLSAATFTLLYISMRMRREGFDLLLHRVARGEPDAPENPYAAPVTSATAPVAPPSVGPFHPPGPHMPGAAQ